MAFNGINNHCSDANKFTNQNLRKSIAMNNPKFNLFYVLEKDDKELIHSAFIAFLLTEFEEFLTTFLNIPATQFHEPELEKTYSLKKLNIPEVATKKIRVDIEAVAYDNSILIIENKFKSFPTSHQLNLYETCYRFQYPGRKIHKALFCFDKELVNFTSDWLVKDYSDLLIFLKENCLSHEDFEKRLFIKHYYEFLSTYYEQYQHVKTDAKFLFDKPDSKHNKFWLRLIYSALHVKLTKLFSDLGIDVHIASDLGNTTVPLLDIMPAHWHLDGVRLFIQFQGNTLEFYAKPINREVIQKLIAICYDRLANIPFKAKKFVKGDRESCYVFKTLLSDFIKEGDNYTLDTLTQVLVSFFDNIENRVLQFH